MSDAESPSGAAGHEHHDHEGPDYSTPQAAVGESEPETTAAVTGLYVGTDVDATDHLVDRGERADGSARAREVRWPDGDCTSGLWRWPTWR